MSVPFGFGLYFPSACLLTRASFIFSGNKSFLFPQLVLPEIFGWLLRPFLFLAASHQIGSAYRKIGFGTSALLILFFAIMTFFF